MIFPAELKVDYVRVYQRKGHTNVGCDPPDYPTATYIENHIEAYTSMINPPPPVPNAHDLKRSEYDKLGLAQA
jgi:hypothetical protein